MPAAVSSKWVGRIEAVGFSDPASFDNAITTVLHSVARPMRWCNLIAMARRRRLSH